MNLFKKIDLWQNEGIINSDQALAIKKFENEGKKPILLYMFLSLSAFCIGVGLISLIASNWDVIPAFAKLLVNFMVLLGVAYGIFISNQKDKTFYREALIVLYSVMIVATIGLVAQIYHLTSSGYSAFLFWSLLVMPLLYITKKSTLPFVWFPVFHYALVSFLLSRTRKYFYIDEVLTFPGFYTIFIISVLILFFNCKYKDGLKHLTNALSFWMVISIAFFVISIEFTHHALNEDFLMNYLISELPENMVDPVLRFLFYVVIIISGALGIKYKDRYEGFLFMSLCLMRIVPLVLYHIVGHSVVAASMTFVILGVLMWYAYTSGRMKLFNLSGGLIAARIFVIYIQLFGSLLTTGVGLIVSGLVLLLIVLLSRKIILSINKRLGEKINETK